MRWPRVYTPESLEVVEGDTVEIVADRIRERSERYWAEWCEERLFTRANGSTFRALAHPWTTDPREARVLITPPPWSVS